MSGGFFSVRPCVVIRGCKFAKHARLPHCRNMIGDVSGSYRISDRFSIWSCAIVVGKCHFSIGLRPIVLALGLIKSGHKPIAIRHNPIVIGHIPISIERSRTD